MYTHINFRTQRLLVIAVTVSCLVSSVFGQNKPEPAATQPTPVDPAHESRMGWWREARFGMFVHWGLYAVLAGEWKGSNIGYAGEWVMYNGKIPVNEYEQITREFNPVKFDAEQWVKIAADAGMRYIVITSKHHDGFCLWDSKVSDYDVMATPFKRDILGELARACKANGRVHLCFYYSIMDWHHPDAQGWNAPGDYNTMSKGYKPNPNFTSYVKDYLKPQLKELITQYDPAVLWFDGEWVPEYTPEMGRDLYRYLRELKSDLIMNNRIGKSRKKSGMSDAQSPGDFGTPEQHIPGTGLPGVDWETCMTMNDTWGFRKDDVNWKSSASMIRDLIDVASKGGNLLLNVGPTGEGEIPAASVQRLAEMGQWMQINGESIHGTTASPFQKLSWGRATQRPGTIYLHVLDWPKDGRLVVPLRSPVKKAYPLSARDAALAFKKGEHGLEVNVPLEAPDKAATVIALEISGKPEVIAEPVQPHTP